MPHGARPPSWLLTTPHPTHDAPNATPPETIIPRLDFAALQSAPVPPVTQIGPRQPQASAVARASPEVSPHARLPQRRHQSMILVFHDDFVVFCRVVNLAPEKYQLTGIQTLSKSFSPAHGAVRTSAPDRPPPDAGTPQPSPSRSYGTPTTHPAELKNATSPQCGPATSCSHPTSRVSHATAVIRRANRRPHGPGRLQNGSRCV